MFYATEGGLKLYLEQSGDVVIQNMFYNDWKSDHFFSNVFVFVPSGQISAAIFIAPGCMHDSQLSEWGGLYEKLAHFNQKVGAQVVGDSAFDKRQSEFLIKSTQDKTNLKRAACVNKIW